MHEVCSAFAQPKACLRANCAYLGRMSLALMFTLSASLQHLSIHVSNRNSVALRLHMRVRLTTVCPLSLPPAPIKRPPVRARVRLAGAHSHVKPT